MYRIAIGLLCITILNGCNLQKEEVNIAQWGVYELVIAGPSSGNPFIDTELSAVFKNNEVSVAVPGFYDGEGIYRIRFSPEVQGLWEYKTKSNISALSNMEGEFRCIPPTEENHGPVAAHNTFSLSYADGTPYYAVGTTAYQWTSVSKPIQEKTLHTLAEAPFNKIRMCLFPKSYKYGNDSEPWAFPFAREGDQNDFTKPNYEFFQNFDQRIQQLLEMGIQADVILFHPYDQWGYCTMGNEMNTRYVRYMIARLSAYRNVWWSLANEWDVPEIKDAIDWEGIGTLLQHEDPHHRLRGIHNWYGSQDHFFDHTRPWVTHVSAQTSQFYNAQKWRNEYQKPLLFDEMRYEGDVPSGWGSLSGQEMVSYFWMAGLSGGYGTHGETFNNHADDSTEVRWWAKGGKLVGESAKRIGFFKEIMQEAPIHTMAPELRYDVDSTKLNTNVYIFSKKEEYYLVYIADGGDELEIDLADNAVYEVDVIDTWNMEITPMEKKYSGRSRIELPKKPYLALRIVKLN